MRLSFLLGLLRGIESTDEIARVELLKEAVEVERGGVLMTFLICNRWASGELREESSLEIKSIIFPFSSWKHFQVWKESEVILKEESCLLLRIGSVLKL